MLDMQLDTKARPTPPCRSIADEVQQEFQPEIDDLCQRMARAMEAKLNEYATRQATTEP